jgi:serine/threonine protein kinase
MDRESASLGELLTKCFVSDPLPDPHVDPNCQKMVNHLHALGTSIKSQTEVVIPATIRDYRLGKKIGQGGMGIVFEAEHIHLRKKLAIKILSPDRVPNQRFVKRFQREMTVIGKLDHPNIVRATDAGVDNQYHYLVMEYIDGLSLSQLVHQQGMQPVEKACQIIYQAAQGLQHAWEHSLVHRDIKPNNLMLTKSNETKVLDLGLALFYEEDDESISLQGQIMGTADYMAPEQWESSHTVDIRADIYSLGCTLYFLLAGFAPYKSFSKKMRAHLNEPFPSIREIRQDVPEELGKIIEKMTAKTACNRFATPNELIQAIQPFTYQLTKTSIVFRENHIPVDENKTTQTAIVYASNTQNTDRNGRDSTQSLLPSVATEKRRKSKLTWFGPAGILLTGIVIAAILIPKPKPTQTPIIYGQGAYESGMWHEGLAQTPLEFRWGNRNQIWKWNFDKSTRILTTNIERIGVLSVGEVNHSTYVFRAQLQQFAWTGNFGIFIGGKIDQEREETTFTRIELFFEPDSKVWYLKLGSCLMRRIKEYDHYQYIEESDYSIAPIRSILPQRPCILEVHISPGGIESISWDGHYYPELLKSHRLPQTYTGELGIFCRNAAIEATSAQIYTPK